MADGHCFIPMSGRCAIFNTNDDAPTIMTLEELPYWKQLRPDASLHLWDYLPSRLVLVGFKDDPEYPDEKMLLFQHEGIDYDESSAYQKVAEKMATSINNSK